MALDLIDADGLVIRQTKFRKSRLVPIHETTAAALDRYVAQRCAVAGGDAHVFVAATGRPPDLSNGQWVLTAAHFPEERGVWLFGHEVFDTKRIIRHPQFVPGAGEQQWTGWDIALVELERPVTAVRPAARYRGKDEVGKVVTKIGYGYLGDGANGLRTPPAAERIAGNNVIDAAGGSFEGRTFGPDVLVFDFDSPLTSETNRFGSPTPVALEIGGAKGDSGGGVFAQDAGEWQLFGIVSGGLNRGIRYGSVAALARASTANAWIDSMITNRE